MKVLGGTYRELVLDPLAIDDVAGSGFRAAAALSTSAISLVTAVDTRNHATALSGANALGFQVEIAERDSPVEFQYQTPMSPPSLIGRGAEVKEELTTSDETVLWFGMVEAVDTQIDCDTLVYDPQTTSDPNLRAFLDHSAPRRILCANAQELLSITAERDQSRAARKVCEDSGLSGVVIKRGALGCLAYDHSSRELREVGSYPTNSVWKLGSGDVFSAGLYYAITQGASILEAAQVASKSAAWWCGTRTPQVPKEILDGGSVAEQQASELKPAFGKVYLAAPFFNPAERWLVNLCRNALVGLGVEVFSPFHDVGLGGNEVAAEDLAGLSDATTVLAVMYHYDPGTLFEVGWARRADIPIVVLAANEIDHELTMVAGTGSEIHTDLTTALYRAAWTSMRAS